MNLRSCSTACRRSQRLGQLTLVAAVLAMAGCAAEPAEKPAAIATAETGAKAGPVKVPQQGALFGAWVRPDSYSQPGRLDAIQRFEGQLGRKLDIVHSYRRIHEEIATPSDLSFVASGATLMISWAGASSQDIIDGTIDDEIRKHAKQTRSLRKPVLMRIRWEMDRPNLAASVGSPSLYREAWRHVRKIFAQERVNNVSWVFCPTAEGFIEGRAADFYPGDDTVDWTCVDVYAGSKLRPMGQLLEPFLRWAGQRAKPIMIGEYGISRGWSSEDRASWLTDAAQVFQANPQIKAVLYFESNPDDRTEHGEFALSDDAPALDAFIETARSAYFNTRP
ncbi:MAG TPA: endoglucanase [Micromonosporaceae bacterium]|nr:endoglucanase [Micromonosporaceae bacterium]HCU51536.1 endoglucanase [Micromonosporaceae bacterium]